MKRIVIAVVAGVCAFAVQAYAKCPVSENTTLVIRAETADLLVDTNGREMLVDVRSTGEVKETCTKDRAQYAGSGAGPWRITIPRDIDLDLLTIGGNIVVGNVDGRVTLRTYGGSVTAGDIHGDAAIVTEGGAIKCGNIGGNAELRSPGTIEAGDVGGNATIHTTAGRITVGNIAGATLTAEAGRTITISKAREVRAFTTAGDISIVEAAALEARSGAGHITAKRVHGRFRAHTELGHITLDSAGSWVEASTGEGDIVVHMLPDNLDGDLHMDLEAGAGNITVYLPPRLKASVEMMVQRPIFSAAQIFSDFPISPAQSPRGMIPFNSFYSAVHAQSIINGGGNRIVLHTSLGKIVVRRN